MLSRRIIRIKVLQSLYTFEVSKENDIKNGMAIMKESINKIYDLYFYQLLLLVEIVNFSKPYLEELLKRITHNPNDVDKILLFNENKLMNIIANNLEFKDNIAERKITWKNNDEDIIKKLFIIIKNSEEMDNYYKNDDNSFEADCKLITDIFAKYILNNDLVYSFYEDKDISLVNDIDYVNGYLKTFLENVKSKDNEQRSIFPNIKKEEILLRKQSEEYFNILFTKTIENEEYYRELVSDKIKNWEIDRLSVIDFLILKMALTEITEIPNVPIKVSLNEYIDISKQFSSENSKSFINGVLDKIVKQLEIEGKINKEIKQRKNDKK